MESGANKKHKSSVFSALFSNPETLRELYSAIEGIDLPPSSIISINTLSDVLFMKQINDVSFTVDDRVVVLIEHQSTINNNVPLRLLMYIARVFEKIIERELLYQKKLVKIPTPEFIVLYNGKEAYPDREELRLSDSFLKAEGVKLPVESGFTLELVVQVYNINHGRNPEILARSKTLDGYSLFMGKIKEYSEGQSLEESIKGAIKYCIKNGVLVHFLKEHGSEVINMLTDELSIEEIAAVRYREGREEGREEGELRGEKKGLERGLEKGREEVLNLLAQGLSPEEIISRLK